VPERPTAWKTFLRAHWGASAAFVTTEVWTRRGLVTFYTVCVIELGLAAGADPWLHAASRWGVPGAGRADPHDGRRGGMSGADLRSGCDGEPGRADAAP